jgi:hypothetical protein
MEDELKTDPETGQQYIVLAVHCLSCGFPVSPSEVDWELFRNWGMPVHASEPCLSNLEKVLTPRDS